MKTNLVATQMYPRPNLGPFWGQGPSGENDQVSVHLRFNRFNKALNHANQLSSHQGRSQKELVPLAFILAPGNPGAYIFYTFEM